MIHQRRLRSFIVFWEETSTRLIIHFHAGLLWRRRIALILAALMLAFRLVLFELLGDLVEHRACSLLFNQI